MVRKGDKPERYGIIAVSTAHISVRTANMLTDDEIEGVVRYIKDDYGFFVYVSEDLLTESRQREKVPEDLLACLDFARENGCEWLMFDSDASTYEVLELHDWDKGFDEPPDIDSDVGYDPYLGCITDDV